MGVFVSVYSFSVEIYRKAGCYGDVKLAVRLGGGSGWDSESGGQVSGAWGLVGRQRLITLLLFPLMVDDRNRVSGHSLTRLLVHRPQQTVRSRPSAADRPPRRSRRDRRRSPASAGADSPGNAHCGGRTPAEADG